MLKSFEIGLKFPPIDFFTFFTKLLDENGFDVLLTDQILSVLVQQINFSDQLKKFFISYALTNMKKASFQRFLLRNLGTFSDFAANYDENEDAKIVCHFLLRRFPTKVMRFDTFYKLLKIPDLISVLLQSIEILSKVDFRPEFLDTWEQVGIALNFLDGSKPRGFSDFLEVLPETCRPLAKMSYLISMAEPNYKTLHDTLLPIVKSNFHNELKMAMIYDFFCRIKFSSELARDWAPDVLFLLKNNEQNLYLLKMVDRLMRTGQASQKIDCGRYVRNPAGKWY